MILGDKIASPACDWMSRLMGTCILQIRRNSKPRCQKLFD